MARPHQDPSLGTYSMVGGRGSSTNQSPPPSPSLRYQNLHTTSTTQLQGYIHTYTQQHTTTHNRATTLVYIKLPMYLLFIWCLFLMVLRRATSLLGALEGVGPENLDFFGPKWHSLCSLPFQGPKKSRFPMPLVMMLHVSKPLHTAPYKQQAH